MDYSVSSAYGRRRAGGLSNNSLKLIAALSMLIDHIGLILINNGKLYGYSAELYAEAISLDSASIYLTLYRLCRCIGRISFPIFCFCLVEGFIHISRYSRYLLRLLLFAIISEIPFDLAIFNSTLCWDKQNVLFNYFIAVILLLILQRVRNYLTGVFRVVLSTLAIIGFCILSEYLKLDYGAIGILIISVFYLFKGNDFTTNILVGILAAYSSFSFYGLGVLALLPIHFYNEDRGYINMKWFFYILYPLQFIILYGMVYIGAMT